MPSHAGRRKGSHAAAARSGAGGRRWPYALLLLAIPISLLAGILASSHPATAALHLLAYLAVGIVLLACQGYAVYLSSKRSIPRPRHQYFLFGAGYLVIGIVSLACGGWADSRHIGWLSSAMVWPAGLSLAGVLVMFGRGAFRGRLRRSFWRIPPLWLDQDRKEAISAVPRRNASLVDPSSAAPSPTVASQSQSMGDGPARDNEDRDGRI